MRENIAYDRKTRHPEKLSRNVGFGNRSPGVMSPVFFAPRVAKVICELEICDLGICDLELCDLEVCDLPRGPKIAQVTSGQVT